MFGFGHEVVLVVIEFEVDDMIHPLRIVLAEVVETVELVSVIVHFRVLGFRGKELYVVESGVLHDPE